jgi:predicted N-formylglutamate amidohydrolase
VNSPETAPYATVDFSNASAAPLRHVLLACDHACNDLPAQFGTLGLSAEDLCRHIAWDIGAANLTRALAARLGCVAVLTRWSRLLIDCNRSLDDPTSIVTLSDGIEVPGNISLTSEQREERAARYWRPYHAEIARRLSDEHEQPRSGPRFAPTLVSVHSFTPVMEGVRRPWHIGLLSDRDPRLTQAMLAILRHEPQLVVGDNEPYSGRHPADYTIDTHAEAAGLPHACIEVRQDLLVGDAGVSEWADRLAACLRPLLSDAMICQRVA